MRAHPTVRALTAVIVASTVFAGAGGCVQKKRRATAADRQLVKEIVSKDKPKPEHALDIRFENKIRLLGYDLSTAEPQEGVPFKVTWYWQVQEPPGDGWKIFTHLADASKTSRINLDSTRPLRRVYPVVDWKRGEYIKDTQEVTIPKDWDSPGAIFYLGFWNGPQRLHVTRGPNDGDNRAEALKVAVAKSGAAPPPEREEQLAELAARRLSGELTLDGKLDEADWSEAQVSDAFVSTINGRPGSFQAKVRVAYDEKHLYLGYEVKDTLLKATHKKADDHLWEQDTVELMVDPDGDSPDYYEIQVSPAGVVFDTRYERRRRPQPFGYVNWNSATKAGVSLDGTLNDKKPDQGYTIEMAVPFASLLAKGLPGKTPAAGDVWRMNFFVMNLGREEQRAVGWSPPLIGDFHVPKRFGKVRFEPAGGSSASAAAAETQTASQAEASEQPEPDSKADTPSQAKAASASATKN